MDKEAVSALITPYPDFPLPGILFQDVHPIMFNAQARKWVTDHLVSRYKDMKLDAIVGLESRGYYFGIPLADALGLPFVPLRKAGKLPGQCQSVSYGLEYGKATIEVQEGVIQKGWKVLVVDDLMATGGTAAGACELIEKLGAVAVEVHVLVELSELNGRTKLPQSVPLYSLFTR